jgi:hypothetical protein
MRKEIFVLVFILLLAVFLRFWQLGEIPPGLYPDVAINGNDALDALKSNDFQVFYPENNGREGLFINLIALSFALFGPSVWAIKVVAAVIGTLTVLGVYLLVKELFPSRPDLNGARSGLYALLTAFLLATSFWHLNFSRIGFRAIMVPFLIVFFSYFLFRAFQRKEVWSAALAGIFFGLGFYTYIAFRVAPLILPAIIIPYLFIYRRENSFKRFLILNSLFFITAALVAAPIGLYFFQHPVDFLGRAAGVSVFSVANPLWEFAKSFLAHLQMFVFQGDSNWRHHQPGWPQLAPGLGVLMFLGLSIAFRELFSAIQEQNWQKVAVFGFLLSWFFVLLLPGVLTSEGIPHALRIIGTIPVAYIFIALAVFRLCQFCARSHLAQFGAAIVLITIVLLGLSDPWRYFFLWTKDPNVTGAFTVKYVEIANFLNSLPEPISKYVVVNEPGVAVPWPDGLPMPNQTIMFLERAKFGERRSTYLKPEELNKIEADDKEAVVVLMQEDSGLAEEIKERFPDVKVRAAF